MKNEKRKEGEKILNEKAEQCGNTKSVSNRIDNSI